MFWLHRVERVLYTLQLLPHHTKSIVSSIKGKAEKGVHILKRLLQKAVDSKSDPYLAILAYRTSPLECGLSPEEMLMNRKLQMTLPHYAEPSHNANLDQKLKQLKLKQNSYYDRSSKCLESLARNDVVRIEVPRKEIPGAVLRTADTPRSSVVETERGLLWRNRLHLWPTETVTNLADFQNPRKTSCKKRKKKKFWFGVKSKQKDVFKLNFRIVYTAKKRKETNLISKYSSSEIALLS
ncbi:hypothetical protein LDENG_00219460 [Lucifuga dentata]|nr:hypothetical protein LDENG_00219460 [Lucifuga dentata]